MYYLKNVRFTVPHTGEEIYFDDGDVEGFYDIINWQFNNDGAIAYITVGHYNGSAAPEDQMTILNDSIVWNNAELEVRQTRMSHTAGLPVGLCVYAWLQRSVCVCCSPLAQCAARTASQAPGRESGRESRSAASTASHVPMERSATPPVSRQL